MTGIKEKTIQAYTEIGCLIKFFPIRYIEKIPNKLLEIINAKADRKYIINVDTTKKINEQKISDQTKKILAVLTYNYWSSNEQKEDLKSKLLSVFISSIVFKSSISKSNIFFIKKYSSCFIVFILNNDSSFSMISSTRASTTSMNLRLSI